MDVKARLGTPDYPAAYVQVQEWNVRGWAATDLAQYDAMGGTYYGDSAPPDECTRDCMPLEVRRDLRTNGYLARALRPLIDPFMPTTVWAAGQPHVLRVVRAEPYEGPDEKSSFRTRTLSFPRP
jgi:hypothetical protein